jgi:hypothetical protein
VKKTAIVIPIYRFPLSLDELQSLSIARGLLAAHHRVIISPQSLEIPTGFLKGEQLIRLPDKFFTYPDGYNRMLMGSTFYGAFEQFEYILIYQLDCLVFRDELNKWCEKGYNYIGSPWYENYIYSYQEKRKWWVGNGGFSLRKVSSALDILKKKIKRGDHYPCPPPSLSQPKGLKWFTYNIYRKAKSMLGLWTVEDELMNYGESEDRFWSLDAGKFLEGYQVAPVEDGMLFGFEQYPEKCFQENGGIIPFGCHAWTKHNRGFIEEMGRKAGMPLGS